jgi:hypothetical protein
MVSILVIVAVLLALALVAAQDDSNGAVEIIASRKVDLEHSFGGGVFKSRGKFTIQMDVDGNVGVVNADKFGITEDNFEDFKALLESGGLYKLRMRSSDTKDAPYVQTSIPVCSLQKSGFKEDLSVFLSADESLTIRGTSYNSPIIGMARMCDPKTLKAPSMFLSRIKVGENQKMQEIPLQAVGSKPYYLSHVNVATETYVDPKDGSTKVRAPAVPAAQQPWYRRYWYLIAAFVFYTMLSPGGGGTAGEGGEKKKE